MTVQTPDERRAAGRAARARLPRPAAGRWAAAADRDPLSILLRQAQDRVPELVPLRNARMLSSAFAFFRGGAAVMAADLATTPTSGIRAQLCGDAHVSNFGGYAAPDRQMVFDINDFDETLPGPWEWDVKRLAASVAIAARDRGFGARDRRRLVVATTRAYRTAMREFAGMANLQVWYSRLNAAAIVERWGDHVDAPAVQAFERRVLKAMAKDSVRAAARLTRVVDGQQRFVSDPPLVVPLADLLEGQDVTAFEGAARNALRSYERTLAGDRRRLLAQFDYVDMARKVVGVGSVGTRAFVVLFRGLDRDDPLVLQVKEARTSVLAPFAGRSRYANEGQRVVEGQRLMQASSDIFLGWSRGPALDGKARDFYVRQLWDGKVSTDVEQATVAGLGTIGQMCGWTLARAHARSGDRVAIAAYLGGGGAFDEAMAEFSEQYADQNERDHQCFADAVAAGRIEVAALV